MSLNDYQNQAEQSAYNTVATNCIQPYGYGLCTTTAAPAKPSPESAAADIVRALKPLSVEDRERVMRAVHILLETSK